MAQDDDWISADDANLIVSIIKHEGDKNTIYSMINAGSLTPARDNFQQCQASNTWPAYIDSEGLDTVGIGHLITGDEPYDCYAGVSDENVQKQLTLDIKQHLAGAKQLAAQYQMNIAHNFIVQRFMTELCFNIGATGYSKFKNGLKKLTSAVNQDGKYSYNDAADEHLDSRWAQQVGNRAIDMVNTLRALDS